MLIENIHKSDIEKARKLLGMNHEQFGLLFGANKDLVMMWERGYRLPNKVSCAVIVAFLIALKNKPLQVFETQKITDCLKSKGRLPAVRKTFSTVKGISRQSF